MAFQECGSLSVELQILTALRFYATGSFQSVIGDTHGISITTVSRCIHRVSVLLSRYINEYVAFPQEENGIRALKQGFYDRSNFPKAQSMDLLFPSKSHQEMSIFSSAEKVFMQSTCKPSVMQN